MLLNNFLFVSLSIFFNSNFIDFQTLTEKRENFFILNITDYFFRKYDDSKINTLSIRQNLQGGSEISPRKPLWKLKEILKKWLSFFDNTDPKQRLQPTPPHCVNRGSKNIDNKDDAEPSSKLQDAFLSYKGLEEINQYFACYQKDEQFRELYNNQFKKDISKAVGNYGDVMPEDLRLASQQTQSLFSCLLFRESAGWKNKISPSGARGIVQFTSNTLEQMKKMLSSEVESDAHLDAEIEKYEKWYKAANSPKERDVYHESVIYLKNKKKVNERKRIMQDYWNNISTSKPEINQIDTNYIFDIKNSEISIHLSMLVIIDCQISYKQANLKCFTKAPDKNFFSCIGAYNMGVGGFYRNALENTNNSCSLKDWIYNLEESDSKQKDETKRHLISVNRCVQKGNNFPMCGTNPEYCEEELSFANHCKTSEEIIPCDNKECL